MQVLVSQNEKKDQQVARVTSFTIHSFLIVLMFLPILHFTVPPPPEQEGILVAFGSPDRGQGNDEPTPRGEQLEERTEPAPAEPVKAPEPEKVSVPEKKAEPVRQEPKATKVPDKKVLTTEDPEVAALKKKQKEDAKKAQEEELAIQKEKNRLKKEEDDRARAAEEETRRQVAAENARKKAEADAAAKEAADYANAKKQYGDVFGTGNGTGRGNTGKPGNQGDPNGDPNSDILTGISTGSGKVGGGLGGRGMVYGPKIQENSQRTGRVVVNVCVDKSGNVISAKYTQKGSTTADASLRQISEESSKRFKFSPSDITEQCGTITYDFKVK